MDKRRILVLYSKSLLAQGVANLLKRDEGLEVIGIDLEKNGSMSNINELRPEAVIIDGDDIPAGSGALILQVLRGNPSVKVLCISVNGSNVDIYRKSQVCITRADELVAAIRME